MLRAAPHWDECVALDSAYRCHVPYLISYKGYDPARKSFSVAHKLDRFLVLETNQAESGCTIEWPFVHIDPDLAALETPFLLSYHRLLGISFALFILL